MSTRSKEIYEFSKFSLVVAERKLLRDGKRVTLTDKAFDTLCALVQRPGELVTKDELMKAVWPDSVVEENNLDQKISMIRRALGEQGRGKEVFIETVRGHGYRFLPDVKVISDMPKAVRTTDSPPASSPVQFRSVTPPAIEAHRDGNVVAVASWRRHEPEFSPQVIEEQPAKVSLMTPASEDDRMPTSIVRPKLLRPVAFLVLIAGIAFLAWSIFSASSDSTSGDTVIDSIAVMPFVNETGNPDNDFLSDGLTESLIGSLSQIPGLSVKARNSVFRYKGRDIDASTVARELGVSGVIFGRFTQRGNDVTLGLELVDARTGNAVWAEKYDRSDSEIISLQTEIARDVSTKLRSRLSKTDQDRITKSYTADPEANRLYLQGMYHLNKRTAGDIRKSIELFEQSTIEDPGYAKAYAGMAMSYLILQDYSRGLSKEVFRDYDQRFRSASQKAISADSSLPEAVLLSAAVKDVDWDVAGAIEGYQRAIELDPNFATPRHWYSRFLGGLGRHEEALAQIEKAHELDPYSVSIAFNVGGRMADARRFDEAIAQYKRVLEMEPNHPLTHFGLAEAYDAKGMYREAIAERKIADVLLEKETESDAASAARALDKALESEGARGYWQKRLEFSLQDKEKGVGSTYRVAICLARLSRFDEALVRLRASVADREPDLFWIKTESAFDPMNNDPRFQGILREIGLPL